VLLVSEVVTNALLRGRSRPRLTVTPFPGGGLYVGVGDDNSRVPMLREDELDALDGRGLSLLDMLSSRWEVRPDPARQGHLVRARPVFHHRVSRLARCPGTSRVARPEG